MKKYRNWQKKVYLIGDIHGRYSDFICSIILNDLRNSYLLVLGDCGFGFHYSEYYESLMKNLEEFCADRHLMIGFIRGNHDNPLFWEDKEFLKKQTNLRSISHIQFIEDNSFIKIKSKWYYCNGGALSIDRSQRTINVTYWENECMKFDEKKFIKLKKELKIKRIEGIFSHTGPKPFARQLDTNFFKAIRNVDKNFVNDSLYEQTMINSMHQTIMPNKWYYGHWHVSEESQIINPKTLACKHHALNIFELIELK